MEFNLVRKIYIVVILIAANSLLLAQNVSGPCEKEGPYHIVVLGSSTAAGSGASTADSAWANRYRYFLQNLNASNQLTNLAVGGYNTYKIMPNGFQGPGGRPSPDTLKNITAAINLNPDAIILNLPSNDVASGFSLSEQTFNMDSIYASAQQAGIPIWICTTQPRNFNPSNLQAQAQMRDTIIAHFSPYVIDFWNGLALSDNSLDPFYDSGDGVHLNDKGHRLLFQRARDINIPAHLFQAPPITDISISDLINTNFHPCGDSLSNFKVYWANVGSLLNADTFQIYFEVNSTLSGNSYLDSINVIGADSTCRLDSFEFTFNTSLRANYELRAFSNSQSDTVKTNDTISLSINSIGRPFISGIGDTLCLPDSAEIFAVSDLLDTVLWYKSINSLNPIQGGNSFLFHQLNSDTSIYAQSVRGPLFYKESLLTTTTSNINWNGTMFDLIANDSLTVDSLALKIADAGPQEIKMYVKPGSYMGFELDSLPWSLWTRDTVIVQNTNGFEILDFTALQLLPGDTIGIYLQMANPTSRLSYHSIPNPVIRNQGPLSIKTGSGISHNFSAIFHPRDWNGEVYFHYGFNAEGDCASPRVEIKAEFSDQTLNLGFEDSTISTNSIIDLILPPGFTNPKWSDGSMSNILSLSASDLGIGIHKISLEALDSLSCIKIDSVIIEVIVSSIKSNKESNHFSIYPNPGNEQLRIQGNEEIELIRVFNSFGNELLSLNITSGNLLNTKVLEPGLYLIEIHSRGIVEKFKWIKSP